jgi:hypothetical protein
VLNLPQIPAEDQAVHQVKIQANLRVEVLRFTRVLRQVKSLHLIQAHFHPRHRATILALHLLNSRVAYRRWGRQSSQAHTLHFYQVRCLHKFRVTALARILLLYQVLFRLQGPVLILPRIPAEGQAAHRVKTRATGRVDALPFTRVHRQVEILPLSQAHFHPGYQVTLLAQHHQSHRVAYRR